MKPIPDKIRFRFFELCEQARDGTLTDAERADCQGLAEAWPGLLDQLSSSLVMDAELRHDARLVRDLAAAAAPPLAALARWHQAFWLTAAAACVMSGVVVWQSTRPDKNSGPPAIATLVKATGCKWAASTLPTAEGSRVSAGTYELVEGLATLKFDSGAEAVLEAPASLELIDAMNCRLRRGTLVSDVPPQAIGFTIETEKARVVDYGTRFGVRAGANCDYTVQVLTGRVEVADHAEAAVHNLVAGQNLDRGLLKQKLNPQSTPGEPNRWQPDRIINDGEGWQWLSTGYGRGKDSYIESSEQDRNFGRDAYFRVKHTSIQPHLNRKGYVAFDLSRFAGRGFENAEFTLAIAPSDLGFATLVPDSTFYIYGLTGEAADGWDETTLTSRNAPAHDPASTGRNLPDPDKTIRLGSFTIAQGVNRGNCNLRGPALTDFLNADTNGIVTFIICRETDETARSGLVHAFATKKSGSNTPPLLRVKPRGE